MLEDHLKSEGYDIPVLGYIPQDEAFLSGKPSSRPCYSAGDLSSERTDDKAGNIVTETVDLDRLYQIAQGEQKANSPEKGRSSRICETGRAGSRFNAIWKSIKAQTTARFGSG